MSDRKPEPPFPDQGLTPPGSEAKMDPAPSYKAPDYKSARKLEGKRALVTGGDSGIGRAVAYLFAREGADVVVTYLKDSEETQDAKDIVSEIEKLGRKAHAIGVDFADSKSPAAAVDGAVKFFGGDFDILVNNAAAQKHRDTLGDLDYDQWRHTFAVNIDGYFLMVKAAVPKMRSRGAIINTGSILGAKGSGGAIDYATSKGAIDNFTKSLAQSLMTKDDKKIRVNCVAPGPIWTPLNPAERDHEDYKEFGKQSWIGRAGQPEELAPTYVFLASHADSSYVTGSTIYVDGGM